MGRRRHSAGEDRPHTGLNMVARGPKGPLGLRFRAEMGRSQTRSARMTPNMRHHCMWEMLGMHARGLSSL